MASLPSIREIRHRTNSVIKDNFFSFLTLTLILFIFFFGIFTLTFNIFLSAKGYLQFFLAICSLFLMRFITSPIFTGVYEWLDRISKGEYTPMQNAFSRFSDIGNALESQKLLFLLFPLWFTAFVPVIAVLLMIITNHTGDIYHTLFYIVVSLLISLKLFSYLFPLPHILISARHIPFFKAVFLSFTSMRRCFGAFLRLICEYLALIAISIVFMGIPFIYTLPYISCSAVIFCDTVFEENKIYKYNLYY